VSEAAAGPDVHALFAPQRALRERFEAFRRALDAGDRVATEIVLLEFERGLRRRIELELRVLQPALATVALPGRNARRELEMQYVQLRELVRNLAQRIAANSPRSETIGFAENLDRRLSAHEAELERVYYPAAWPALSVADREALARVGSGHEV
jgi:hypothetical protein